MSINDAGLSLIATECKSACAGEPDLEKRILKAMRPVASGHWMFPSDDDLCFRGAIGGVLLAAETTEEEKARILATLKSLRTVSAMMNGVPVDTDAAFRDMEDGPKQVPLVKLWHEAKEHKG